jgi:uncharacterized protein YhdP
VAGSGRLVAAEPPSFELGLSLSEVRLGEAAALLGLGASNGTLSIEGKVESIGASAWELASSLNGELRLGARDGTVSGLALAGLAEEIARTAPDDLKTVLEAAFGGGETALLSAAGSWRLTNGVARTEDTAVEVDGAEIALVGELDLVRWWLDLKSEVRLTGTDQAPAIMVDLKGPIDDAEAGLRAAAFLRHLAK